MNLVPSNEIFRKIIHLSASIIPLGYLWVIQDKYTMLIILNCLCLVSIFVEVGRRKWNWIETIFERFFNIMLRKNEFDGGMTGATWLLFGSVLTIFLFPIYIAVPALLFLTIGDTFAALVGKSFPIGKIKQKTLSGTMAGFITSTAAALYVNQLVPTEIILLGAGVAMVVELAPNLINDNVTIPLSGGLAMTYGMMIL